MSKRPRSRSPASSRRSLVLRRHLMRYGHPVGFALGNVVGDANGHCRWMLWSHYASLVDEDGRVAINRREMLDALRFATEVYPTMMGGTMPGRTRATTNKRRAGPGATTRLERALPTHCHRAGLRIDVNEAAVRARPPKG